MNERKRIALPLAGLALFALAWGLGMGMLPGQSLALAVCGLVGGIIMAALLLAFWRHLDGIVLQPVILATKELSAVLALGRQDAPSPPPPASSLPELVDRLRQVRKESDLTLAHVSARTIEQRAWLDVVLRDIAEGVVVCGLDHRIMLCNPAALTLLGGENGPVTGQPLFALINREPIAHALDILLQQDDSTPLPFASALIDASRLLQGRMALVRGPGNVPTGYVLSLTDFGREMEVMDRDNTLRRTLARDLRAPLANLRAAAEIVSAYPGMATRERAAFDEVVVEEAARLSTRMEELDNIICRENRIRWLMADLSSHDLFNCLARDAARDGIILTMVGIPLWLHGDSHALLLAFRHMVGRLAETAKRKNFEIEALLSDRHIYVDVAWVGEPVSSATIETWLDSDLAGSVGGQTLRDVLERHGSEPWSQKLRNGNTVLRIPLPAPERPQFVAPRRPLPRRPEMHDPELLRIHSHTGHLAQCKLVELDYTVVDLETTGLNPEYGDEIIQIGAVRVSGGRVQAAQRFDRLVNPRRPIPPENSRIHGITDALVTDKPPIEVVLPQLKAFVGETVLVAHNAAFDLKFLQLKQDQTGIVFTNPVLDTLLLASLAEPDADPALETVAHRLGISVDPARTALGDAMATAEILVRQMEQLNLQGITILDQAIEASAKAAASRRARGS